MQWMCLTLNSQNFEKIVQCCVIFLKNNFVMGKNQKYFVSLCLCGFCYLSFMDLSSLSQQLGTAYQLLSLTSAKLIGEKPFQKVEKNICITLFRE
jgi:hypothetical protein